MLLPCLYGVLWCAVLSKMDNFLLHFTLLPVGPYSLIVGTVLLSVSLYVDRSYVDGSSCVVFIIDTTYSTISCQGQLIGEKGISVLGYIVSRDT